MSSEEQGLEQQDWSKYHTLIVADQDDLPGLHYPAAIAHITKALKDITGEEQEVFADDMWESPRRIGITHELFSRLTEKQRDELSTPILEGIAQNQKNQAFFEKALAPFQDDEEFSYRVGFKCEPPSYAALYFPPYKPEDFNNNYMITYFTPPREGTKIFPQGLDTSQVEALATTINGLVGSKVAQVKEHAKAGLQDQTEGDTPLVYDIYKDFSLGQLTIKGNDMPLILDSPHCDEIIHLISHPEDIKIALADTDPRKPKYLSTITTNGLGSGGRRGAQSWEVK